MTAISEMTFEEIADEMARIAAHSAAVRRIDDLPSIREQGIATAALCKYSDDDMKGSELLFDMLDYEEQNKVLDEFGLKPVRDEYERQIDVDVFEGTGEFYYEVDGEFFNRESDADDYAKRELIENYPAVEVLNAIFKVRQ